MGRWIEMRGRIIEETSEPVCAQKLNAEMNSKGVGPEWQLDSDQCFWGILR